MIRFLKYSKNLALDGSHVLSYGTKVARVNHVSRMVHTLGYWSQTTSKHINYAAAQLGYDVIAPVKRRRKRIHILKTQEA